MPLLAQKIRPLDGAGRGPLYRQLETALREALLINPVLLGYSLEKRIIPRVALCKAVGVPTSIVLSLHSYDNVKFGKACETVERFRQLEGGVPPSVPLNTCEDDFGAAKLKA